MEGILASTEKWTLRGGSKGSVEELYSSGQIVIWSRGMGDAGRKLLKSFSGEEEVCDAQWFTFPPPSPYGNGLKDDQMSRLPSICILYRSTLHIFALSGEDFIHSMPFKSKGQMVGTAEAPIQIDEARFARRRKYNCRRLLDGDELPEEEDDKVNIINKCNHSRRVDGPWVFSLKKGLDVRFFVVERRNAGTLIPIIQREVTPGSHIHSDEWPTYSCLSALGFHHETVNHQDNYVNLESGANTQAIERSWLDCKTKILKKMRGVVKHMWLSEKGLIFERSQSSLEKEGIPGTSSTLYPVFFSLTHSTGEISPVAMRKNPPLMYSRSSILDATSRFSVQCDETLQIVFTHSSSSLCVTYDVGSGHHCVWKLRRLNEAESKFFIGDFGEDGGSTRLNQSTSSIFPLGTPVSKNHTGTWMGHMPPPRSTPTTSGNPVFSPHNHRSFTPKIQESPLLNLCPPPKFHSSPHIHSHMHQSHHMTSPSSDLSRSPMVNPAIIGTPGSTTSCISFQTESSFVEPEPVYPELCLDFVWLESLNVNETNLPRKAVKAFIYEDLLGQQYLSLLLLSPKQETSSFLKSIRFGPAQGQSHSQLIFGSATSIPALDAIPIQTMKLLLVLEPGRNLSLYSGSAKIQKINLASLHLKRDFAQLSINTSSATAATP
ncbi:unnamed protein product, partial [Darwinula stevensoni]